MPVLICPQCGAKSYARRHLIGQTVRCPSCPARFKATGPAFSPRQWLKPSHPAGLWLAWLLFAAAAAFAAATVWAAVDAGGPLHQAIRGPAVVGTGLTCLYITLGCAVAGGLLTYRWKHAHRRHKWP
jgi:hypothetical protein